MNHQLKKTRCFLMIIPVPSRSAIPVAMVVCGLFLPGASSPRTAEAADRAAARGAGAGRARASAASPGASEAAPARSEKTGTTAVDSRLLRKVTLALKGASLSEFSAALQEQTGVE